MNSRFSKDLARYGPESTVDWSLDESEAYCRQLARSHYENFTVASWLLPSELHQHFYNVYAYCRWSDDLADELGDEQRSLRLLDWWGRELEICVDRKSRHPVMQALAGTIERFEIPLSHFRDLLVAFRQDQHTRQYDTFSDLLAYCRNSANPVGRIVLRLGEVAGDDQAAWSDSICTGLQLANFCQDVASDYRDRKRIYLPQESCRRFEVTEEDFRNGSDNDRFRRLLEFESERAEEYLTAGEPLIPTVPRWLQVDLSLFIGGGRAVLQQLRRNSYNVWSRRPKVSKWTKLRLLASAWLAARRDEPST